MMKTLKERQREPVIRVTRSNIPLIKVPEGGEWDRGNRAEEICVRISQNKANI